ncbi:ArpU family transcriptional regulator [Tumebacillus sp. ITR2]|jgi:ArpU family phage transcriptional regulator|uniref:ArpU family transcriptional regulator n=1 Tax=Tumebacillus amylolyticus TaxID=2801339 RepID=A0ABS1J848_9BACL|nr:ArpU family phage packaging/lysis transcriptional regulator [Tumebacillus amylolyticus]MBL0386224.1 ArpU family transcriptional regulator [Tumebacillus amylolyticus]
MTRNLTEQNIETKKTRARVEGMLESCRLYMQIGYHPGQEARTTARYSLTPSSVTNAFHSSTESIAQKNVDEERRRRALVESVWAAVEMLNEMEQQIVKMRYLEDDDALDYIVWGELNLSERKYYRVKARAFLKLALAMGVAVYKEAI